MRECGTQMQVSRVSLSPSCPPEHAILAIWQSGYVFLRHDERPVSPKHEGSFGEVMLRRASYASDV